MKIKKFLFVGTGFYLSYKLTAKMVLDPEVEMSIEERFNKYGLKLEKHYVTTEDNYVILVHRVINPENTDTSPIYLQHG